MFIVVDGGNSVSAAIDYIRNQFIALHMKHTANRRIFYTYTTTATDSAVTKALLKKISSIAMNKT
jgi:hypothetical protein